MSAGGEPSPLLGGSLLHTAATELLCCRLTIEVLFVTTIVGALLASLQSFLTGTGPIYFEVVSVLLVVYTFGKQVGASSRAAALADQLEAGAVFHNNHGIFQDLHLEFPGVKQSGFSRESKVSALDHYGDTYGFAG